MQDSSRTEELRQQISRLRDTYNKKQWIRIKRTFFVLSGVIYLIAVYIGMEIDQIDMGIKYLLSWLVAAPLLAGFIMFISQGILFNILAETMEEEKTIARLIGQLEGIEEAKRSKKD